MEDSSRFRTLDRTEAAAQGSSDPPPRPAAATKPQPNPAFLGHAMKSLLDRAEVSVQRGDETRVITKGEPPRAPPGGLAGLDSPLDELPPGLRGGPFALLLWLAIAAALLGTVGWLLGSG